VTGTRIRGRFAHAPSGPLMPGRLWPAGMSMWAGHIWDWMHHIGLDSVVARAVRVAAAWSHMRLLGGGFPLQHDAVSAHKYGAVKFVAAGITGRD
jgi:hypothetical protein